MLAVALGYGHQRTDNKVDPVPTCTAMQMSSPASALALEPLSEPHSWAKYNKGSAVQAASKEGDSY